MRLSDPDMDGYSSADDDWTVGDGADAFPSDNTQWSDWDEDGFGDNYETSPGSTVILTGRENTTNTLETRMPVLLCRVILGK